MRNFRERISTLTKTPVVAATSMCITKWATVMVTTWSVRQDKRAGNEANHETLAL